MRNCPKCRQPLDPVETHCPYCGMPVVPGASAKGRMGMYASGLFVLSVLFCSGACFAAFDGPNGGAGAVMPQLLLLTSVLSLVAAVIALILIFVRK
jgi:hypothetical protein